jgi:hypothetical protein
MKLLLADHVLAMAMVVVTAGVLGQWRLGRTLLALMRSTYIWRLSIQGSESYMSSFGDGRMEKYKHLIMPIKSLSKEHMCWQR